MSSASPLKQRINWGVLLLPMMLFGIIIGIILFFPPFQNSYYPQCIFKKLTTYDCPGCGSARSIYSLLQGNIKGAADYNLLSFIVLPTLFIAYLQEFFYFLKPIWQKLNKPSLFLIIIIAFWILRNLDDYPFYFLHSDK